MIVLSCVVSQNSWCMVILFNDDMATTTSFFGPNLVVPFGVLFFICCSPSRILVAANIELFPA